LPVAIAKDSPLWVTQIEGSMIEDAGVIKMDFLGLKTLSIQKTALELIKHNHDVVIDLDTIPLDDAVTFELYQKGETNGTFQFESVGMQKHLRELKPDCIRYSRNEGIPGRYLWNYRISGTSDAAFSESCRIYKGRC